MALVTGRRFDFARPVIEQIDAPLTLIVSGGALVKAATGPTLVRHLLPAGVARSVIEATRDFRDATAVVFDRPQAAQVVHERLDIRDSHRRSYFERNRDFITEVVPLEAALVEDPIQVMFSGGVARMRELVERVRALEVVQLGRPRRHRVRGAGLLARRRQPRGLHQGRDAGRVGGAARGSPPPR